MDKKEIAKSLTTLKVVDCDTTWRATANSMELEKVYGKTDKGTGC